MKRVVITGMGIVSPVGTGIEFAWKNILAGVSGIRKIESIDVSDLPCQIAGVIPVGTEPGQYNVDAFVDAREQRRIDKSIQYAIAAAAEAMADARLTPETEFDHDRAGVSLGGGIGGLQMIYDNCVDLFQNGPRHISPFLIPGALVNMSAGQISIKHNLRGPNLTIATACASGTHAIGEAARMIQRGDADIMVVGGSESSIVKIGMAGFCSMKALSTRNDDPTHASRPWDRDRDGFVLGEGAGILVLEEYGHAVARGAKIYAEIAGYGMSADAHHITAPAENGEGGMRAMSAAIRDAGLQPADIDYINAHGTSTGLGDLGELMAVKNLFAGSAVSMSSTKSMTGHLMGAAGAIEAIFSVLAIRDQVAPPTMNLDNPIPEADGVDLVPNKAKPREIDAALSNSFGFGGTNASVVFKKM